MRIRKMADLEDLLYTNGLPEEILEAIIPEPGFQTTEVKAKGIICRYSGLTNKAVIKGKDFEMNFKVFPYITRDRGNWRIFDFSMTSSTRPRPTTERHVVIETLPTKSITSQEAAIAAGVGSLVGWLSSMLDD